MRSFSPLLTAFITAIVTVVAVVALAAGVFLMFGEQLIESTILSILEDRSTEEVDEKPAALADRVLQETHEERVVKVAETADPAVVSVFLEAEEQPEVEIDPFLRQFFEPYQEESTGGSGFIVSADGYVVTNRHVVEREASYSILTNDGKTYSAEVVARDPVLDVAVLKIQETGPFEYLEFGDSDELQLGQSTIAIGNALGEFQNSVSVGVVSGLSRSITAQAGRGQTELLDEVIQTDAAINLGNSGGPLLNLSKEVIGVNVAMAVGQQNVGFAIPSNLIEPVVVSIRETGRIVRAFLGIRYTPVTPLVAEQEELPVDYGVLIVPVQPGEESSVVPDSPAAEAGLKEGDVILEFDGHRLDRQHSLAHIIRRREVGEEVSLRLWRAGEELTVTATLTEAPVN